MPGVFSRGFMAVPELPVFCSVRTEPCPGYFRGDLWPYRNSHRNLCTAFIPVPGTSVCSSLLCRSSARGTGIPFEQYPGVPGVRVPVRPSRTYPETSVSSARSPYPYPEASVTSVRLRYPPGIFFGITRTGTPAVSYLRRSYPHPELL